MRINTLDQNLANQIAAGEIVDRPASVVKELFENSVDAGAKHITIEIKQGGHELIRIIDNGCGIHFEDLWLAIRRHSTSKITSQEDLAAIQTLGFRGEALASIAAVSRFKLISRQSNTNSGFYVHTESGSVDASVAATPIAHPEGTTIEVRDLFFNTPARRKFLRKARTEFFQIESILQRLSLCNFQVAIKLIHNQKVIYDLPSAETMALKERRLSKLLSSDFMKNALAMDFSAAGMRLWGWIALPTFSRAQPDSQYFYLNQRYVRDKVLNHAVRNAYEDILYHGRYPAFVLYLECDPRSVDVNVHPTKQEVRLQDSRLVHDFIVKGVRDALSQVKPATQFVPPISVSTPHRIQEQPPLPYNTNKQSLENLQEVTLQTGSKNTDPKDLYQKCTLGFAIAQLHNIYILAQTDTGFVMVDMHAAHERILYEKIKAQVETEGGIQRQVMLVPISLSLSPQEMRIWEEHQAFLDRLGFVTASSGPSSIIVREMPALLKGTAMDRLIKDMFSDLQEYQNTQRSEDHIYSILGNMACRSAIKANHRLNIPEMNVILRDMENTPNSGFCNHGRPTWVQWSLKELDAFFLRGQ